MMHVLPPGEDTALAAMAQEAAETVVGNQAIDRVEVRTGLSFYDEPTYEFYFRLDPSRIPSTFEGGDTLLFLTRRLREALAAQGREQFPVVHLLDENDWRRWTGA